MDFRGIDLVVWAAILAFGAFQFFCHLRAPDFPYDDVAYYEQAKSILHDGFYGFNSVPERVQPPGLAVLLAMVCKTFGCTRGVLLPVMAVFLTLGLLASYELIRREEGRGVAASTVLLLGSSVQVFTLVTGWLWPAFPYIFFSSLSLLVAMKLGDTETGPSKYFLSALLSVLVAVSILIQSAGIALLGALALSIGVSFFRDRQTGMRRLKLFLPALVLGAMTQFLWMHQVSNPPDWPLPGYPATYISQLAVKDGSYPELGVANGVDVALRFKKNLQDRTATVTSLLARHWINPSFSSLGTAIPIVFIILGVWSSIQLRRAEVHVWYFLGYELIYLLWPWPMGLRFVLPSVPLACLYIFRGGKIVSRWVRDYPRTAGSAGLPFCLVLGVLAAKNGWAAGTSWTSGLQLRVSAVVWFALAVFFVSLIWRNLLPRPAARIWQAKFWDKRHTAGGLAFSTPQFLSGLIVAALVMIGLAQDIQVARRNLAYGQADLEQVPDIMAARWLFSHTDSSVVIAARHVPLVYHYAQRRTIWFAPISRPEVMMRGIRQHHIRYIVVIDQDFSAYLPPDEFCFERVETAYPRAFRLADKLANARIYEVLPQESGDVHVGPGS